MLRVMLCAALEAGGAAVDAVTEAIVVMEDDPSFNAGFGAALNRAGVDNGMPWRLENLNHWHTRTFEPIRNPTRSSSHIRCERRIGTDARDAGEFDQLLEVRFKLRLEVCKNRPERAHDVCVMVGFWILVEVIFRRPRSGLDR